MARHLTHQQLEELLGVYALDAVDTADAAVIESHLLACPRCRAEVGQHREAATLLAFSGADAPYGVWTRVAAHLEESPPPLELPPELRARARASRRPRRLTAAVISAAAVGVIGALSLHAVSQERRTDELAAITEASGLDQAAAAAAVAPGARTARMTSQDGASSADAVVLPDGHGYLVPAQLPPLSLDRTYQLWGVIGTRTISLGVLGDEPTISSFRAAGPLTSLAITAEAAGGAIAPTTTPVVRGDLINA